MNQEETYSSYLHELALFNIDNINLGLGPITDFMERLGNPQNAYPSVLIGGTNGKGSISSMVAAILKEAGLRTGLYTSPHLIDVRERIRIDGQMIPPAELSALVSELRDRSVQKLTYFEFLTALAFVYFQRQKVDMAILEVGLGGRLDATNVATPLVSVISNVAFDHMEYLGNTLGKIAGEKGGIIKERGLCLTAVKGGEAPAVLENICNRQQARLKRTGKEIRLIRHRDGTFSCFIDGEAHRRLRCGLIGRHQQENAALAVAAVQELSRRGKAIPAEAIRTGLTNVRWEGRMEVANERPRILLDGAHNPAGVKILCDTLKRDFSFRRLIVIFGVLSDKDYRPMLRRLAKTAATLIITRPDSNRALAPSFLLPLARGYCREALIRENPREALALALLRADEDDLIVVAGSLYLLGQVKKVLPSVLADYDLQKR